MRKSFIPILLLLLVAASCNNSKNEVETQLYTLSDSVYLENEYEVGYSYYTINVDLPETQNATLKQSIMHWMFAPEVKDYEDFLQTDMDRFFDEEGSEPKSVYENNHTLAEQTDRYVTYITEGFLYTGGAHPMPWYYGTSFSKIDGSIVGYDMFDDPEQLAPMITENIRKQHFEFFDMEEDMIELAPEDFLQLPTNEPWIEADSVVFCYEPYEIAPYVAGMPLCKISKEDLQPYLSEKGKSLLNH